MKGRRTSAGNREQFEVGDVVKIKRDSQWHTGETGTIVDCEESRVLVTLPGPQPRTQDREWVSIENIQLVRSS